MAYVFLWGGAYTFMLQLHHPHCAPAPFFGPTSLPTCCAGRVLLLPGLQEKRFWERMANVIPDKTSRVWGALEKGLTEYNSVLNTRASLIQEVPAVSHPPQQRRGAASSFGCSIS